ncbi:expressed unknown protein [Seminavis robusta]|uniref:Uncharacterized protein n=1 Tax=Seminavis robusta TaxID=568900 RepID=A0A9N8HVF0_9STRA|nr:expressed unknown protein [Seminavis robusta]|eukprot:Sro1795_g298010.1 n/a (375) ;mRNA; f:5441-6738
MCATDNENKGSAAPSEDTVSTMKSAFQTIQMTTAALLITTIALLIATCVLAADKSGSPSTEVAAVAATQTVTETVTVEVPTWPTVRPPAGENPCAGKKPDLPNIQCVIDAVEQTGEQAGANVTKGYNGLKETEATPITQNYYEVGICPVNVHWHLGAEHYSLGEFDETGTGPTDISGRRKLAGKTRQGFQCKHYNENDAKFTTPYEWKHCDATMEVGQTYEVHWPHSAAGACGTINQYQTPFYDGVFCRDGVLTDTAAQIGVQGQVFTIVNDEAYYYPDLMRGMIVDGEFGADMAMYTGSTTGTSRDNEICSQYAPITWQVDRKCHLISASTFDKMCADMKAQRDDMSDDLYAHGSRELVADHLAANNHANLRA